MTQNPSLPDPYDWHSTTQCPCPVCGLNRRDAKAMRDHRRVRASEGYAATHVFRVADKTFGHRVRLASPLDSGPVANPKNRGNRTTNRGKQGVHGPTAKTKDRIIRACTLLANGKTRPEVAAILKVTVQTLYDLQFSYSGLWAASYDAAMTAVRDTVRQLAGTDSMPEDMQAFLLAGIRAQRWSQARGEKLFDRGDALTLPRFYEEHYLPMRPQSQGTIYTTRLILRRWTIVTADPPLTEITKLTLALFRDTLLRARGLKPVKLMSPNTVAGYMERVQQLLDKAGPPGRGNRDAAGILPGPIPWVKPPSPVRKAVRIVSNEVIENFYRGCIAADRPQSSHFKPKDWWRALVVTVYNIGLRRGTLFKLRTRWIDWKHRCIAIPAEFTKTGVEQVIPLNQTVMDHLQTIRGEGDRLFDFGSPVDRYFYTYLHWLQDQCGIPRAEHFGLHALRRTCASRLWASDPAAAQLMLGHTSRNTTKQFYVQGRDILAAAVEQMPQPAAFCGKDGGAC